MNFNKNSGTSPQEIMLMKNKIGKGGGGDIPTKVSELENDVGYLTLETLPIYDGGAH